MLWLGDRRSHGVCSNSVAPGHSALFTFATFRSELSFSCCCSSSVSGLFSLVVAEGNPGFLLFHRRYHTVERQLCTIALRIQWRQRLSGKGLPASGQNPHTGGQRKRIKPVSKHYHGRMQVKQWWIKNRQEHSQRWACCCICWWGASGCGARACGSGWLQEGSCPACFWTLLETADQGSCSGCYSCHSLKASR